MAGWGGSVWGSSRWGIGDSLRGHIPTSPEFPSADVNTSSTISILPDYLEVSITKGTRDLCCWTVFSDHGFVEVDFSY